MPDLQSELSKIASAWDTHEQAIRTPNYNTQPQQEKAMTTLKPTGNATRDIFTFIKTNGHKYTQAETAHAVARMGYKAASVHAVLTQMKRSGMAQADTNGFLFTTMDEYKPLSNPYKANPVGNPRKTKIKKQTQGIAALPVTPITPVTPSEVPKASVRLVRLQSADEVMANMSVAEAHKLYVALDKMFGSKQ